MAPTVVPQRLMYMSKSEWMGSMSGSRTHFVNKAKYLLVAFLFLTPYIDGVALQTSPTPSTQQSNATPAAQKSTAQKPAQKGAVQPAARQPVKEGASGASNQEKNTAKYLQAVCSLRELKCYAQAATVATGPPASPAVKSPARNSPAKHAGEGSAAGPPAKSAAAGLPVTATNIAPGLTTDCAYNKINSFERVASASDAAAKLTDLPPGFSLSGFGTEVFIYATKSQASTSDLALVERELGWFATTQGFRIEFTDRSGSAYTSGLASAAPAPTGMTVTVEDGHTILVTTDGTVSCNALNSFLTRVSGYASHRNADAPVATVLYLDPAATANAVAASAIPFAGTLASAAGSAIPQGPPVAPTVPASPPPATSQTAASNATASKGASTAPGSTSTTPTATVANNAVTASTTNAAAPAANSVPAATTASTPASSSQSSGGSSSGGGSGASPSTPALAAPFSINGRQLLFGSNTTGDDAWITEKKRALALLDLPQPQVLINTWSLQNSTNKADEYGRVVNRLHDTVNEFNDVIQSSITAAWRSVNADLRNPSNDANSGWEPTFHNYVSQRAILAVSSSTPTTVAATATGAAAPVEVALPANTINRSGLGACKEAEYCLGYTSLLSSVNPRITDLLIGVIGAKNPLAIAENAIQQIQKICVGCDKGFADALEKDLEKELGVDPQGTKFSSGACQAKNQQQLIASHGRYLPLECFRAAVQRAGGGELCGCESTGQPQPGASQFGLIRAALADFLFQYKMSSEYPHDFSPYDLSASAQALDGALAPFTEAFNEDLQTFQSYVRAKFIVDSHRLQGSSNAFLNSGIITVRTTSGDTATMSTGTQSFLDQSRASSVNELVTSITGANPAGSGSGLTGVLSNLSFNQAQVLEGALAAYQSRSLNISRQLNLTVKPRSLLGASAAETDVVLNADQGANAPNYWSPSGSGGSTTPDLSSVTQHDVTTHVRIDSVRLFEVSSFSAVLSKGRDKFPILPPFVELPYIGTLAGIPLKPATEYHTSSAMMSAIIVPTATDLAYTLRYVGDRVWTPVACSWPADAAGTPCTVRRASSFQDFGNLPILEFHRQMLACIAAEGRIDTPTPAGQPATSPTCNLTFDKLLHDESL